MFVRSDKSKKHHDKNKVNAHHKKGRKNTVPFVTHKFGIGIFLVQNSVYNNPQQFIPPKKIDKVKHGGLSVEYRQQRQCSKNEKIPLLVIRSLL